MASADNSSTAPASTPANQASGSLVISPVSSPQAYNSAASRARAAGSVALFSCRARLNISAIALGVLRSSSSASITATDGSAAARTSAGTSTPRSAPYSRSSMRRDAAIDSSDQSSGCRYCALSSARRMTSPGIVLIMSCTSSTLPSDFDIFVLSILRKPLCSQKRANVSPPCAQVLCASSFS